METPGIDRWGSRRHSASLLILIPIALMAVSACTDSKKTPSASPPSTTTSTVSSPASTAESAAANALAVKSATDAVSGFISNVRVGKGAAACAFLTDAEQTAFVKNATGVKQKLDTKSCASVATSFNAANKAKLKY